MGCDHFRPEKYGMVFCPECHGSGKNVDGNAPCLNCGGFGLLIRNENPCLTVLWGDSAGLRREGGSSEQEKMKEICCPKCGNDCNYELVKCLTGRKYQVKCQACGRVFVIGRRKDEIAELTSKC
jgi:RecJ-like exonuclease